MSAPPPSASPSPAPRLPEILAPAGDLPSLEAALAAGADAVYFGLDEGFNARARAANFTLANLPDTVARIHRAGARAYLTLNTLVFEPELPRLEEILRAVAASGVDALIVQDPAVALLAREVCPALEVHASTQMTVSSAGGAAFAKALGVTRVVVPRELSVAEIRRLAGETELELEVFIHGALCVSWSGQCLTSEAWGGRSANRGQCAQSCRMPYTFVVDGQAQDLGDVRYLLSPKDMAGVRAVPALAGIGVSSLKIEGRQKGPMYVATSVRGYRRWVDAQAAGAQREPAERQLAEDLRAMALSYTRGFADGFLAGSDHQSLVEGRFPKSRGLLLGRVASVGRAEVTVAPDRRPWTGALALDLPEARAQGPEGQVSAPLPALGGPTDSADGAAIAPVDVAPGMGVVFDAGDPEDKHEPGGPIFRVDRPGPGGRELVLGFGQPGPDLGRVRVGDRVWVTRDPAVARDVERLTARAPEGRVSVDLTVSGAPDAPLQVTATARGAQASAASDSPLTPSSGAGLTAELLASKLGAFGGTPFRLGALDLSALPAGLHLPVSELKRLRRALVEALTAAVERGPVRALNAPGALDRLRARQAALAPRLASAPELVPLCRSLAQLEAVIAAGLPEVELDWMELVGLGRAVARAREAGLRVTVATLRIEKPGEEAITERIARLRPDGVLVRHWGALTRFSTLPADARPQLHGDFSLNVTNGLTAHHLLAYGLDTLTASFDLDEAQLMALVARAPADRLTVMVHHRIPTFHTEHCLYAHLLSRGRDYHTCGRPCEAREASVRDHLGQTHPVIVDAGCRNTVFNARPQSAASLVPRLLDAGVRRFRVELVRETAAETAAVLDAYQRLLAGQTTPAALLAALDCDEQLGVARGGMKLIS